MESEAVKTGTFLYNNEVRCDIRIVRRTYRPGTGDPSDEAQFRDDLVGTFYEIQYGSTAKRGGWVAGGGFFDSLEAALGHASSATQDTVIWSSDVQ